MSSASAYDVIITVFVIFATSQAVSEPRDYCQSSIFNATCPPSHVILMTSAFYGRMKTGSCVSGSYGQIGCKEDVLDYMDRKCSGMTKCSVYIAESELHARNRCPRDLAVYLEAAYTCIKAVTSTQTVCSASGKILITSQQGYLTSQETIEKNLGTQICPWLIRALPGQTISITYYNFGGGKLDGRQSSGSGAAGAPAFSLHSQSTCYEVGTISERKSRQKTLTTCGGENGAREGLVYTSLSNEVLVTFLRREVLRTLSPFVIKFEAKGCPTNVIPPPGSYVIYERTMAIIKCNHTDEVWYLTCTKNQWMGSRGNCSQKHEDSGWTFRQTLTEGTDGFPYGILIVVSIGVALGVFIGGLVLSLVYFYMKRKRNPYQEPPQTDIQQDYYHTSTTLKKPPIQSTGVLVTRDICPTITYDDHEHICHGSTPHRNTPHGNTPQGSTPHIHDGYYSAKPANYPVTRVYDACASSVQRSGHVYESPQAS